VGGVELLRLRLRRGLPLLQRRYSLRPAVHHEQLTCCIGYWVFVYGRHFVRLSVHHHVNQQCLCKLFLWVGPKSERNDLLLDNHCIIRRNANSLLPEWLHAVRDDLFKGSKRTCIGRFVFLPQCVPLPWRLVRRAFTD